MTNQRQSEGPGAGPAGGGETYTGLKQLTDEQVRTWTLEQKDRWWRDNVWRGDMPQLTIRAAVTGMLLGGILSLTNLYVGAKTGWTLGVGITSVILAFAMFKTLSAMGWAKEFTVLENNCMQSIATAAGYMTSPMISSLAAYMLVTNTVLPMGTVMVWIMALAVLGVLFAFPLKKRFINDEQMPFPEGRAAGIVMDALHTGSAREGLLKAKILLGTGAGAAFLKLIGSHAIMDKVKLGFLTFPEYVDTWIYRVWTPRIWGTDLRELTIRPDTDFVMMAAGGLMGIRTGVSLLVGAVITYFFLAPWMIVVEDIHGVVRDGVMHYGFRPITTWALWGGVAMMTTSSLFAFFSKPQILISAFRGLFGKGKGARQQDILKDIELPMSVFVVGIPVVGGVVVFLAHFYFGVKIWQGIVAIPLIFLFTLIGVNSTALTSITPIGAMGKLTQLTYGLLARGNIRTNLATASITAEVSGHASNLLMDIKPGYMLGAKPRQQAIGHVLGIIAGALASVPVFYLVFMHAGSQQLSAEQGPMPAVVAESREAHEPMPQLITEQYPMPAATIWKAVAEVLTKGLSNLEVSARWAALIGALLGIMLEGLRVATRGRFWLSGVGLGLATVIPFNTCFAMFLGSFFFWVAARRWRDPAQSLHKVFVQNLEPVCAGVIAGGAIMGIAVILLEIFVLGNAH